MKDFKKVRIKDVIKEYPEVLEVLKEYNIPCATCKTHNCFFKDIPEAENLSMENESIIMSKISDILNKSI